MSARDELLASGQLGEEGARLLYSTVRLVAIGYNFPPPDDEPAWNEAAVQTVAHQFLGGDRGQRRLLAVVSGSRDDREFGRLLEAAVRNFMREQSRSTDFGKLIVRVKAVLRRYDGFAEIRRRGAESTWALVDGPTEMSTTPAEVLSAAIRGTTVVVPRWSSERRDAPLADSPSFVRMITAILNAADGSLTAIDIAHILTSRLDYRKTPFTLDLARDEGLSESTLRGGDLLSQSLSRMRAAEIYRDLSDRDRIIVATMKQNVRDLGEAIGVGKSQAAHLRQRLGERLSVELVDDDDSEETVRALIEICNDWVQDRTELADGTFH